VVAETYHKPVIDLLEGMRPIVSFEIKPWGDKDCDIVVAGQDVFEGILGKSIA